MSNEDLGHIRGAEISMIFQDPLSSLHPYYRVGWQIVEMIRAHQEMSARAARRRAIELLRLVGIPQPEGRGGAFFHPISGGKGGRGGICHGPAGYSPVRPSPEPPPRTH